MSETEPQRFQKGRAILLAALFLISAGAIAYSVWKVSYRVDGREHSEGEVTELSLTHRVQRDKDGKLSRVYYPGDEKPESEQPAPGSSQESVEKSADENAWHGEAGDGSIRHIPDERASGASRSDQPSPESGAAPPPPAPKRTPEKTRPAPTRTEPRSPAVPPGGGQACPT